MTLLKIENNGPELVDTNYWITEHAEKGFVYLSANAGCFRLLVPESSGISIPDMQNGAQYVILSRGPWTQHGNLDALEILFEDHSDNPLAIHILRDQADLLPTDTEIDQHGQSQRWTIAVYTKNGKQLELPVRYRTVKNIPYLKEWSD